MAEIGAFLGVYRGVISICSGGGFGGYSSGRMSGGPPFSSDRDYRIVQTSRPTSADGVARNPQWILYPAEDGMEGYCERVR